MGKIQSILDLGEMEINVGNRAAELYSDSVVTKKRATGKNRFDRRPILRLEVHADALPIPRVILVSGKKQHGKDTVGGMFHRQLRKLQESPGYSFGADLDCTPQMKDQEGFVRIEGLITGHMAFADPIKRFVKFAYGWNDEHTNGELKEVVDPYWNMTPRQAMQDFGSALRNMREDIFAKSAVSRIMHQRGTRGESLGGNEDEDEYAMRLTTIITDCRFPNEIDAFRTAKDIGRVVVIRVHRPGMPEDDQHISETALDGYGDWDYFIDNSGSKTDLLKQVTNIMHEWVMVDHVRDVIKQALSET